MAFERLRVRHRDKALIPQSVRDGCIRCGFSDFCRERNFPGISSKIPMLSVWTSPIAILGGRISGA